MDVLAGVEYRSLLAQAKSYLPFLKVLIGGTNLGIQKEHLGKLRCLYQMVDVKRFVLIQAPTLLVLLLAIKHLFQMLIRKIKANPCHVFS